MFDDVVSKAMLQMRDFIPKSLIDVTAYTAAAVIICPFGKYGTASS
jgi:hypothetical protein